MESFVESVGDTMPDRRPKQDLVKWLVNTKAWRKK